LGIALLRLGVELRQRLAVRSALLGLQWLPGQHQGQTNPKQQFAEVHNYFMFSIANRGLPQS
jgi:hypothetical protein